MPTRCSTPLRRILAIASPIVALVGLTGQPFGGADRELRAEEGRSPGLESRLSPAAATAAIATIGSAAVDQSKHVPPGYSLTWCDEFDGADLDLTKWGYRSEGQSSDGSGVSVLSRDCVSLDGRGRLRIATRNSGRVLHTGMISTTDTFEPRYGYFEARIRFQRQQGHHGAFWLKPRSYGRIPGDPGSSGVEIDVAEFFGSGRGEKSMGVNVYWRGKNGENEHRAGSPDLTSILARPTNDAGTKRAELCDEFHVYGLIWTPEGYQFFVDGHEVFATDEGVSHQGQPVILSLLAHKWEVGKLDREKLDDAMLVDYVRVYQLTDQSPNDHATESAGATR